MVLDRICEGSLQVEISSDMQYSALQLIAHMLIALPNFFADHVLYETTAAFVCSVLQEIEFLQPFLAPEEKALSSLLAYVQSELSATVLRWRRSLTFEQCYGSALSTR